MLTTPCTLVLHIVQLNRICIDLVRVQRAWPDAVVCCCANAVRLPARDRFRAAPPASPRPVHERPARRAAARHHRRHHRIPADFQHRPPADRRALAGRTLGPVQHRHPGRRDPRGHPDLPAAPVAACWPALRDKRDNRDYALKLARRLRRHRRAWPAGQEDWAWNCPTPYADRLGADHRRASWMLVAEQLAAQTRRARSANARRSPGRWRSLVGLAQVVAGVFPGTSRSARDDLRRPCWPAPRNRGAATEFAFLVGIPTMFAATGYELLSVSGTAAARTRTGRRWRWPSSRPTITAFVAVKWLLRYIQTHRFTGFAYTASCWASACCCCCPRAAERGLRYRGHQPGRHPAFGVTAQVGAFDEAAVAAVFGDFQASNAPAAAAPCSRVTGITGSSAAASTLTGTCRPPGGRRRRHSRRSSPRRRPWSVWRSTSQRVRPRMSWASTASSKSCWLGNSARLRAASCATSS